MNYSEERAAFDCLRKKLAPDTKAEYENSFNTLMKRYNTTIRENRFVVGGAVEVFTFAILRSVGIECDLCGATATDGDIILASNKIISVKGTFTGGANNVKIMNKLGGGSRDWHTATFFIISKIGIVYGDPDIVDSFHVKDTRDGLEVHKNGILELMRSPENIIPMQLQKKPPTTEAKESLKASEAVAKQIIIDTKSRILTKFLN